MDARPLEWEELARDLRLAWYYKDQIYVFSLEGCVRQGFLPLLSSFQWDAPILMPDSVTQRVRAWRETLQTTLWVSAHILHLLVAAAGLFLSNCWIAPAVQTCLIRIDQMIGDRMA